MWTDPADPDRSLTRRPTARRSLRFLLPALVLALLPLAACSDDAPPPDYSGGAYDDVHTLLQRTLNQRAVALRKRDLPRFRRTLDRSDAALVAEQRVYFDNLADLPVGALRFRVLPDTIAPEEGTKDYWAEVVVALRLDGYDAVPVRTRDRFRFTPSADGARMVVASTTDHAWEADHPGNAQPWDLGRVRVEQEVGVLGIFDDGTVHHADEVIDAAASARHEVRSLVGAEDSSVSSGVVIYSLQDPTFLRGLAGRTVGDPDRADGLTIAVPADGTNPRLGVASYRIFLNPRVLDQEPAVLGRLVRHELTHATLGPRGRGAPIWISEGIAEYVSVRPMPPSRRRLPASALDVGARATALPGEAEFGGPEAEAWYAVAWWVCEYIAATYGENVLFTLLRRLERGADQDDVLREVLGITSSELTQRGVALMARTYDQ